MIRNRADFSVLVKSREKRSNSRCQLFTRHKKSQQQITVAGFKQNTPQWIPVEGKNAKEKPQSGDPVVTPVVTELSEQQFELLRLWSAMDETAKADLLAMARRCAAQSIENGPADR
ncbi:hypothetical protein [Rosistilla oblonga]|uniref:hypothetical protein n=1 Tax=Rosistilla oblonga TaxID=2527990 RepID=UPI003A96BF17